MGRLNEVWRELTKPREEERIGQLKFGDEERYISGVRTVSLEEAKEEAKQRIPPGDPGIFFGGVRIPSETNFLMVGASRSGKTTATKAMLAEVLHRIKAGSGEKVIVYDDSQELVPFVFGIVGDQVPVHIFNPSDERCVAWKLSVDIRRRTSSQPLSEILVAKEENDEPFFINGAQSLVRGVMDSFLLSSEEKTKIDALVRRNGINAPPGEPFDWTLRDVCLATSTPDDVRAVLNRHRRYFKSEIKAFLDRNNDDIFSTIIARMQNSRIVGAMWDKREHSISLKEFRDSKEGQVIIITGDEERVSVVRELNRFFFERASQTLLSAPLQQRGAPRFWIFLDEFTELGRLRYLKTIIKKGLKRGIRVVLAVQNFDEVREVYGEKIASVLLTESGAVAIFQQKDKHAKEFSEFIGRKKVFEITRGTSTQRDQETGKVQTGWNEQTREVEKPAITEEQLKNAARGEAFYQTTFFSGVLRYRPDYQSVLAPIVEVQSTKREHRQQIERHGFKYEFLEDWTPEERARLGLPLEEEEKEKAVKPKGDAPPARAPKKEKKGKAKREEKGDEMLHRPKGDTSGVIHLPSGEMGDGEQKSQAEEKAPATRRAAGSTAAQGKPPASEWKGLTEEAMREMIERLSTDSGAHVDEILEALRPFLSQQAKAAKEEEKVAGVAAEAVGKEQEEGTEDFFAFMNSVIAEARERKKKRERRGP